ncbi:MAG TPA: hypothetical protein VMW50_08215 [Dehalococcoidia bacterium]|nr:hypothetical protein [Dehalococcoidia bacterium]
MKLYRICTENIGYAWITKTVAEHFESFTIIKAEGYWHGHSEHSLIIEIVTDDYDSIIKLSYRIKKENRQESVLVQVLDVEAKFV